MPINLFGQDVIKSISFDEGEILRNIQELHCPNWFELDPCYSVGRFYSEFGIPKPKHRFDISPQVSGVVECSADKLPIEDGVIKSIMFDPPFLASSGESHESNDPNVNIIANRFSVFPSMEKLWDWYSLCIQEFNRVLTDGGVLVFKNQDTVSSAKNYFSHVFIMNEALKYGFYPKDMFILLVKNRIIGGNHSKQQHARKFHSYYWVFEKKKCKVDYNLL